MSTTPTTTIWSAATGQTPNPGPWSSWPPRLSPAHIQYPELIRGLHCFSAPALDAVRAETQWDLQEPMPVIDPAIADKVARGEVPCPRCSGEKLSKGIFLLCAGRDTGFPAYIRHDCPCAALKRVWGKVLATRIEKRFYAARLETLAPYTERPLSTSVETQQKIIDYVRQHPDDSYLFCGLHDSGKSWIASALLRHAAEQQVLHDNTTDGSGARYGAWFVRATDLMEQNAIFAMDRTKAPPFVSTNNIGYCVRQGIRPVLLIDEIDKFGSTEPRLNFLAEIVGAIEACEGQIIACSNVTSAALVAKWGPDKGEPILSRISGRSSGHEIDFDQQVTA